MRFASTIDRTEIISTNLKSSNLKAELVLEYEKDGVFVQIEDLDESRGVDWSKSLKRFKYANYGLTPLASTIKFNILNKDGEYSPGSGTDKDNIFDIDTKIRLRAGYIIKDDDPVVETKTFPLTGEVTSFYKTSYNSSDQDVELDVSGTSTIEFFNDLFTPLYDSETYDDSTYTPDAYFVSYIDNTRKKFSDLNSISVTSDTTKGTIYYKLTDTLITPLSGASESTAWVNGGATVNGEKVITINDTTGARYVYVAVILDGTSWGDSINIGPITAEVNTFVDLFYTDIFYLDTPVYDEPAAPTMPTISCSGRDVWKKAIETEVNLQDLSGGVQIDQLVKDVCDSIGLQYTADSIADLSDFPDRTLASGLGKPVKAIDIFEQIIQILNQDGLTKYRMYLEYDSTIGDNIVFVQPKPEFFSADFVLDYRDYVSIGSRRNNYDKLLKRITVLDQQESSDKEELLVSTNHVTAGTKVMSWAGDAEYKRYSVTVNTGDAVVTLTSVDPTNITFEITGATIDVDISIHGLRWTSAPLVEGESINHENMVANNGITTRIENKLLLSDTEAKNIAKGFIDEFGSPVNEVGSLRWPYLHLLLEQNDSALLWSRFVFLDDIFAITGIKYHWDRAERPSDSTVFTLDDTGKNFADVNPLGFLYDTILEYNKGYIYDMALGPLGKESDVDTTKYKSNLAFS